MDFSVWLAWMQPAPYRKTSGSDSHNTQNIIIRR